MYILAILPEDLKNMGSFSDEKNCLIATACKRQFGATDVEEWIDNVCIDGKRFLHEDFHYSDYVSLRDKNDLNTDPDAHIAVFNLTPAKH